MVNRKKEKEKEKKTYRKQEVFHLKRWKDLTKNKQTNKQTGEKYKPNKTNTTISNMCC